MKPAGVIPEPRPEHHDAEAGGAPALGGREAEADSLCWELPVQLRCRLVVFGPKKYVVIGNNSGINITWNTYLAAPK